MGFEPTRRLNTAYAISNLRRAPYQVRALRPDLSHFVRLVWHIAAFVEVSYTLASIACAPVLSRLQYGLGSDAL